MKITTDTPELLVLRNTRWKSPLVYGLLTLGGLWLGVQVILHPQGSIGWLLLVLLLTVAWTLPMALLTVKGVVGPRASAEALTVNATGIYVEQPTP